MTSTDREETMQAMATKEGSHVEGAHGGAHDHPTERRYVEIAAILAVVTAVEVGLYYTDLTGLTLISILVGLAVVKFGMVAAYFMHLKFDAVLLRRLFVTGIVLALLIYTIFLVTLDVLIN